MMVFSRHRKQITRRPREVQTIAIASGKGGVGKTWLSTTLSTCFARAGRRTLLVDGDLGLANADIQLGVSPQADLAAVMAGWIELEDAITAVSGGAGTDGGFDFLAGRSGSGAISDLAKEEISRLAAGIASMALRYDMVILDLAAGIDGTVMRLVRAADRALVVANDEPTSLTDAYAFIKMLRGHAPRVDPWVVINMARTRVVGRRTYEALARACETFLGFRPPLAGIVLRDEQVRDAIRQQKTLPNFAPRAQAAMDAFQIAETILRSGMNKNARASG